MRKKQSADTCYACIYWLTFSFNVQAANSADADVYCLCVRVWLGLNDHGRARCMQAPTGPPSRFSHELVIVYVVAS
jgi:hypothetical protein